MVRSQLLRAGFAAVALAAGVVPAGARELEFPAYAPAGAEEASAPAPGRFPVARPFDLIARVAESLPAVTHGVPAHAPGRFQRSLVAELPGAVPEGMAGHDLLWNAHDAGLLDAEFSDDRPLALWTAPPNILILRNADVRVPADLEGLRIRVVGTNASAIVEALGAVPVHVPAGEIRASLETGLIDGVVGSPTAVSGLGLEEVANSYTLNVPLGRTYGYLAMDRASYDRLSEARKAVIDRFSGRPLSRFLDDAWSAKGAGIVDTLKARGDNSVYSLTVEQRAAFAAVIQPVTEALVTEHGLADVLAAMRAQ